MKFNNKKGDLILVDKNGKIYNLSIIKYSPETADIEQIANIQLDRSELQNLCSELDDVN